MWVLKPNKLSPRVFAANLAFINWHSDVSDSHEIFNTSRASLAYPCADFGKNILKNEIDTEAGNVTTVIDCLKMGSCFLQSFQV